MSSKWNGGLAAGSCSRNHAETASASMPVTEGTVDPTIGRNRSASAPGRVAPACRKMGGEPYDVAQPECPAGGEAEGPRGPGEREVR